METPTLTPETASRVLDADLGNILKRVKSGQTLTEAQRKRVEAHTEQPDAPPEAASWPRWADNLTEAARVIAVTRQSLTAWRKEGCLAFKPNGKVDLHELRTWIAANGRKGGPQSSRLERARLRVLTAQAQRLETENGKIRGELVPKCELGPCLRNVSLHMRTALQFKVEQQLAPNMTGKTTAQAIEMARRCVDEVCDIFNNGMVRWMEAPPAPAATTTPTDHETSL